MLRNGAVDAFQTVIEQLLQGKVPMTAVSEAAQKLLRVPSYLVPRPGRRTNESRVERDDDRKIYII